MTASSFEAIQIVSLNDKSSNYSGDGDLINIHLTLSRSPSSFWRYFFSTNLRKYMPTFVEYVGLVEDEIIIKSTMEDLQQHIDKLKKVVSSTRFRTH